MQSFLEVGLWMCRKITQMLCHTHPDDFTTLHLKRTVSTANIKAGYTYAAAMAHSMGSGASLLTGSGGNPV